MTFDLVRILESKRAYRRKMAVLPVAEKLRILDAMRERGLAIRRSTVVSSPQSPERAS